MDMGLLGFQEAKMKYLDQMTVVLLR